MTKRLRTVFMGTPEYALPSLACLRDLTELQLVVTQPDRPFGRGQKPVFSPVKQFALDAQIPVIQPTIVKGRRFARQIEAYHPDVIVTAAFGRILGKRLLSVPRYGCLNVHASILPSYRGAAPISRAILTGERETGVSIMKTIEELDAGPVFWIEKVSIGESETAGELTERLAVLGATALGTVLGNIDTLVPIEQDPAQVSFAPPLSKLDGRIVWSETSTKISRKIRGFHPWPCAFTAWRGRPFKIHSVIIRATAGSLGKPGTILSHDMDGIVVACLEGALLLKDVQVPGKKRLTAEQFFSGYRMTAGESFE